MYIRILTLATHLYMCRCFNVDVSGEISFLVREPNRDEKTLVMKLAKGKAELMSGKTVAPLVECVYQYPQESHINAILSNTMNELTKVFIRGAEYMRASTKRFLTDIDNAVDSEELGVKAIASLLEELHTDMMMRLNNKKDFRRGPARFRVVHSRGEGFFEQIYSNMTHEYRSILNTSDRVDRTDRDPCIHQEDIKNMWLDILTRSKESFMTAATKCLRKYLTSHGVASDSKTSKKLTKFLNHEVEKIKVNQLKTLCNDFQLCYDELL